MQAIAIACMSMSEPPPDRVRATVAVARIPPSCIPGAQLVYQGAPRVDADELSRPDGFGRRGHLHGEFDPGSGRTLAACLTHASGATNQGLPWGKAANGGVTPGVHASMTGTTPG